MSSPRVLHVVPSLDVGGSERQLVQLIRHVQAPERHHVAVFDRPGQLAERIPNEPVWVGPLGRDALTPGRMPLVASRIRRAIHDHGIQLVHAHHDLSGVVAAIATPRRIPLVAERQGVGSAWVRRRSLRALLGLAHRRIDLLICNAHYLEDEARQNDLRPPPIAVVYPGVDRKWFAPVEPPTPDRPTVAVVANLTPVKRHDRFLRAFATVIARIPRARAVLAGHGPEGARLRSLAAELGLEAAVEFAGLLDDPRPVIGGAHVVCLTSATEGFPNALLEAMSMARPVVATGVGGIPELVRDGVDGILTDGSPASIADALGRLLGDLAQAAERGVRAAERASEFELMRMVEGIEAAYRRVAAYRHVGVT